MKIYILLTRFPGNDAKFMCGYTRCRYSHVSIGLQEDMGTFYSFICKGFIEEDIARYNKPGRAPFPCELYELEVSDDVYHRVRDSIHFFRQNRAFLRYARLGLVMSLIHIPFRQKNRYFCSHFVAEVLHRSRVLRLKKQSSLYLPKDFQRLKDLRMVFRGDLLRYVNRYGKAAAA